MSTSSSTSSAATTAKENISKIKTANLQKKTAETITKNTAKLNEELNSTISALAQPIYDVIEELKPVPPKLRSVVDVQGAKNKLYDDLDSLQVRYQMFKKQVTVEKEVPITAEDYYADPESYPGLLYVEIEFNEVTDEDAANSGYTKTIITVKPEWFKKLIECFPVPEERDIVAQQMEKLINTSIKAGWNMLKPAVSTLGSLVPIPPINTMMNAVTDAIDGIVKIASTSMSEEELNKMIAKKDAAKAQSQSEADKATKAPKSIMGSIGDMTEKVCDTAANAISDTASGITQGVTDAFKNLKAPEIPKDVKNTIIDMKDAIIYVKDNLSNIYIMLILKLIGKIVDCFNQIIKKIGVPELPDPLGKIPQIITDAESILEFVMGLPMSLINAMKSIIQRKIKMISVAQTPIPVAPLPEITSLPSTAEDVLISTPEDVPGMTEDDIEQMELG